MKFYQIYFSPTGGTKKIADIISDVWECEFEEIDLTNSHTDFSKYHFNDDDICIISVPSFGGRVPGIASERLNKMTGGNAKAILVCVYGNRDYDDTLLELEDILDSRQFQCSAAIAAVAEHSIMHQFAEGRPDQKDEKDLQSFVKQIREKLYNEKCEKPVHVSGNKPYRKYGGVPIKPKSGKECNNCGKCADKCPVQAIDLHNPKETDNSKCISCMMCVAVCPKHARKVNGVMVSLAAQKMKKECSKRKNPELFI